MKRCNSCQAVQDDTNKFCIQCGSNEFSPIREQVSPIDCDANTEPSAPAFHKRGKVFFIAGVAAVAVIVTVIIIASTLFNPVNQIMRDIHDDAFSDAENIYWERIAGDSDKCQKAYDEVSAYVEELLKQYRIQEITYDYLMNKLYGIDQIGILNREITYAYTEADYLHSCRETYTSAEKAFDNGNYEEAISLYAQVADANFENGENAIKKYNQSVELFRAEVVSSAQEYIDSGEYSMAMTVLEYALYVIPGDSELQSVQQSCIQAEYDDNIQHLVEEAQLYIASNDYVGALSFLDSCILTYPEELILQQKRSNCLAEYEAYVIGESLRLANAGEFQHALSLSESGLNYFTSTQVTELTMILKSHIPVILGEMEMFQNKTDGGSWRTKTDTTNKYLEDNYGNTYANSLSVGCGSITYLVNFKYRTFSGTVGFPKNLESDGARKSATLTVYGDGEKIAEFVNVNDASKPESFSLDIFSYEKLTLKWECEGYNIWSDWGYFATIFDGVFVPVPLDIPSVS